MKIFARPTSATVERNKKMPRYDRMGSRYAYEVEKVYTDPVTNITRVKLVGFSKNHTLNYTIADYTFENAMGTPVDVTKHKI